MENQLFVSMLGSSAVQQNRDSKSDKVETNSSAFNSCLEAATSDKANTENDVIAKKETRKEAAERQKAEKAEAQAQAKADQAKMTQNPQSMGSKAFLYDMMYRNPDTLSMAEKQAMKLDEASKALKMQNAQPKENAGAAKEAPTQAGASNKEATALAGQKFDELLGKTSKKEEGKQLTTEAGQAASGAAKGEKAEKADDSVALNSANKAEETHKTQRLTQTQKRQQVINQIVTHMEIRNFTSRDELTLRLNPEYLGELKIKINRGKDGELSAQFITDSEDTREVLQESRAELREHIEKKGMNLRSIDIEMVDHIA